MSVSVRCCENENSSATKDTIAAIRKERLDKISHFSKNKKRKDSNKLKRIGKRITGIGKRIRKIGELEKL